MDGSDFEAVFAALGQAGVRYLVVGGVAVVLHGHPRVTADLDLFVDLDGPNLRVAMAALGELGFRPRAPVAAADFADAAKRRDWIRDKGMVVFSLWSPAHPLTSVDVFVDEPLPFREAMGRSIEVELGTGRVRVLGLADLIALKRRAGRPKDLDDVRELERLAEEKRDG